jgi:hypothetical protein
MYKNNKPNLVWDKFEQFYTLITSSQQLEKYAFQTYPDLSYFLKNWAKYKNFKLVLLIGHITHPQRVGGWD